MTGTAEQTKDHLARVSDLPDHQRAFSGNPSSENLIENGGSAAIVYGHNAARTRRRSCSLIGHDGRAHGHLSTL
jgi:hypothetical protein